MPGTVSITTNRVVRRSGNCVLHSLSDTMIRSLITGLFFYLKKEIKTTTDGQTG